MSIKINPPLPFQNQGKRPYQEDYLFPQSPDETTRLFVVCDGMGGLDRGEVASQTVADAIGEFAAQNPAQTNDDAYLIQAVAVAHQKLQAFLDENIYLTRMGTTLTFLSLNDESATVAHIGDSRVYHIRNGEILYKTKDHKQVVDMVREGIITPEQAVNHPWRNRLSRSISVNRDGEQRPAKPDVNQITDLAAGDYFLLCTDGVLEQLTDEMLCTILKGNESNESKKQRILELCQDQTNDNYSGILIQISEVAHKTAAPTTAPDTELNDIPVATKNTGKKTTISASVWAAIVVVIIGMTMAAYYLGTQNKTETPPPPKPISARPTRKITAYHNLKPLKLGLQLAQNQAGKYGILNAHLLVVLPFEYDDICLCHYQTHLRLKKDNQFSYLKINKLVQRPS